MVCSGTAIMVRSRSAALPVAPPAAPVVSAPAVRPDARRALRPRWSDAGSRRRGGRSSPGGHPASREGARAEAGRRRDLEQAGRAPRAPGRDGPRRRCLPPGLCGLNPNHAEAHRNLAVVLDRQGRSREAVDPLSGVPALERRRSHVDRADVRRRLAEYRLECSSADEPNEPAGRALGMGPAWPDAGQRRRSDRGAARPSPAPSAQEPGTGSARSSSR